MRRRVTLALLAGAISAALAMAAGAPPARMFDPPDRPQPSEQKVPLETTQIRRPVPHLGTLKGLDPISLPDSSQLAATSNDIAVTVTVVPQTEIQPSPVTPSQFALHQNMPNPVVTSTTLRFSVALETRVRIEVFSVTGQRMAVPVDQDYAPGIYTVPWNGAGLSGRRLPAGLYVMRMSASRFSATRKLMITP